MENAYETTDLVAGAAQLGGSMLADYDGFQNPGVGADGRIDIGRIGQQSFEYDYGAIGGGLASGAMGIATGNPVLAVAGLGSAAISGFRQVAARNKFRNQKQSAMRDAMRQNFGVDYRQEVRDNMGGAFNDAWSNFY